MLNLEEEAAQRALFGTQVVASHDAIIARMQVGAKKIFDLFEAGKDEEAYALWNAGILER